MKRIDLFNELKSIATSNMPELALVDMQKGQIDPQKDNTDKLPALLFEFRESTYESSGKGNQLGKMLVSIYLYQAIAENQSAEDLALENARILNNLDNVFQVFSQINVESFSPLERIAEQAEETKSKYLYLGNNTDGLVVLRSTEDTPSYVCTRIDFTTQMADNLERVNTTLYKIENANIEILDPTTNS